MFPTQFSYLIGYDIPCGADIDNILYFTKVYPNTKVFKLEQNYRSTQTI